MGTGGVGCLITSTSLRQIINRELKNSSATARKQSSLQTPHMSRCPRSQSTAAVCNPKGLRDKGETEKGEKGLQSLQRCSQIASGLHLKFYTWVKNVCPEVSTASQNGATSCMKDPTAAPVHFLSRPKQLRVTWSFQEGCLEQVSQRSGGPRSGVGTKRAIPTVMSCYRASDPSAFLKILVVH